ncbi:hypothetical protein [Aestuariivirga sp.]|uniref:hypothetical protein n=1 Tax=Aestuariivirga sp. TaxID=2650926 RepID=UPI0039E40E11
MQQESALAGSEEALPFPRRLALAVANAGAERAQFFLPLDDAVDHFREALVADFDPRSITQQFKVELGAVDPTLWFLGKGEWTRFCRSIEITRVFGETREVLEAGDGFRGTEAYQAFLARIRSGDIPVLNHVRMETAELLDGYFQHSVQMIARARARGIERHTEADVKVSASRPEWLERMERNAGLAIDRDGSFIRIGPGKHRMAVAKLLGLSSMPFEIRLVHVAWLRQQMAKYKLPAARALRAAVSELTQSAHGAKT